MGDSIAHDLRTPPTRARVRLERSRNAVRSRAGFRAAIDETIRWLDGALAPVAAILRIGEVEHGRRRAGFGRVALPPFLREAAIVRLCGCELRIGGGSGCAVDILAPSAPAETMPADGSQMTLARG